MSASLQKHWDLVFSRTDDRQLGWYEETPTKTLQLLEKIPNWQKAVIFIPGAGTSNLIDILAKEGAKLILNDISQKAIEKLQKRLKKYTENITWLCQNIALPIEKELPPADIWIDRAVLHFLTEESDIAGYFKNLKKCLKPNGYALLAEYSTDGAERCAGLPVHRYSLEEYSNRLGPEFQLIQHFHHTYINPNGSPRPYIYALYRRNSHSK